MKIDYTSTEHCYGRVSFNLETPIEELETYLAVKALLREFSCFTKNILCKDVAIDYWVSYLKRMGIPCNYYDIQVAYDLAYGDGCEFEWGIC